MKAKPGELLGGWGYTTFSFACMVVPFFLLRWLFPFWWIVADERTVLVVAVMAGLLFWGAGNRLLIGRWWP